MSRRKFNRRPKIPGFKRKLCFKLGSPHIQHDDEDAAELQRIKLANKFKGSEFEVFICRFCKRYHVGKPAIDDEDAERSEGE